MGQGSSQHQVSADMAQRNRIVLGPSMSPTPESEEDEMAKRGRQVIGPSMSPTPESEDRDAAPVSFTAGPQLPADNEMAQPGPDERSSKRGKKKEKRRKTLHSDTWVENVAATRTDEVAAPESAKKSSKRKKRRKSFDSEAASQETSQAGGGEATAQEPAKESNKKKKKKSRRNHSEPDEDDALIDGTHPKPRIEDVEEPQPSPKRKRRRSKKKQALDDELPLQSATQEGNSANGAGTHGEARPARDDDLAESIQDALQSPVSAKKKRPRRNKANEGSNSDSQEVLVSHAIGGSPTSAQPSNVTDILKYESLVEDDEDDVSIIPSSQWQQSQREVAQTLNPSQLNREPSDGGRNSNKDPQVHFARTATNFAEAVMDPVAEAMRGNDPQNNLDWLHKRENMPHQTLLTSARDSLQDTALPDLQPSQIKTEAKSNRDSNSDSTIESSSSSSDDSDSHSPSVQRLESLSRSRSRSASRAPDRSGHLADETLGLVVTARPGPYEEVPYSAPSSTGSNRSIPARLPSPSNTGSHRSIPARIEPQPSPPRSRSSRSSGSRRSRNARRNYALTDVDAMDIDPPVVQDSSPLKKRAKKATPARKRKADQPVQFEEADTVNSDAHEAYEDMGKADEHSARISGDAMDVDQSFSVEDTPSPQLERRKNPTADKKKKKPAQSSEPDKADHEANEVNANADTQIAKSIKSIRRASSDDNLADMHVHLMANGVSGPDKSSQQFDAAAPDHNRISEDEVPLDSMPAAQEVEPGRLLTSQPLKARTKRQSKPSLVSNDEAPNPTFAAQDAETLPEPRVRGGDPAISPKEKAKKRAPRSTALNDVPEIEGEPANEDQVADSESEAADVATAARNDNIEPGESASQPQPKHKTKGKKKRVLGQSKASLSLSQIEGDEDQEDFSTIFSRKKSAPQPARGSNEPEESQVGVSQAPSPEKLRKPKRKRRTGASEDELESLLAAGPSKGRKQDSNLGLSDGDREAKRKRLSTPRQGKATGPWTQTELNELGRVVQEFMEENSLGRHDLNQLVQAVPNKADPTIKEFWDKVEQAIPQRTRKQITERARRIYHNFVARGTWTQEQKEEVHELFETRPKKWTEIAGIINRDPKDVRDYWRNQYLVFESQIKSRWSKGEEERLREVMEEALSKIRIMRENSDQPKRRSRARSIDDEAMIDWQQISAAMDLTRSRQQCKWKWIDLREKGLVGDDSIHLPSQPRSSAGPSGNNVNGISEELANAREDYRGMDPEEKYRLIDAIKDCGAREDKHIPWRTLVDDRFRTKWHRPVLRLVWYRLRQTVPDYEDQDVEANARFLVNYYHMHQLFPRFDDHQADEQAEEKVIHYNRGRRIWTRPSSDLRALRERQRRSSSASSRASNRLSHKVSSEILNLSDDERGLYRSRQSAELGEDRERGRYRAQNRDGLKSDEVSVNIPGHLKGEAAKKALAQARGKAKKGKVKGVMAEKESRRVMSNSVAVDSESEGS